MENLENEALNGHPNSSLAEKTNDYMIDVGFTKQEKNNYESNFEIQEKLEREKRIDEWLPITSKRNAKWWYSAFHNITAMVGAGVLGLPYAMSKLGCYSTISWAASIDKGIQENVQYGYKSHSKAGTTFDFFNALGTIAFAYAGHNVVLEIQATIPSTPQKPSKVPMWRGVVVAYIIVAFCYFPVAIIGYLVFGNEVKDNILISLEKPKWLIATANLFVVIHVIGSYQIYAMPVFDMIETLLVKKFKFEPNKLVRFVVRNVYVAFTMFIAITFPFFDGLLGFFGGFVFAPTTYFLPCILWMAIKKPKKFGLSWWTNWICIALGLCLMILSSLGGLRRIIIEAKTYKFYSSTPSPSN
ncbi:lysine histidine transporter 1-like isoform X3 [Cicer arietinum]|uniref:Lysine histidine transporter 1-like isoform X4 n=1 Tax=Cicer arietinum TaxID=3827 RepID=A0A3Q7Y809_CICAR|nr:lysine histidine transporter 1-like isoform X4 [Cicer arietinum]